MKIYVFTFSLTLLALCSFILPEKYQAFDEFKLKGINPSSSNSEVPFVIIEEKDDSIWVDILNMHNREVIKYINMGTYWYTKIIKKDYYDEDCLCDTNFVDVIERYIFNDTIMAYIETIDLSIGKSLGKDIILDTRTTRLKLSIVEDLGEGYQKYDKLKYYIKNYKKLGFVYFGFDDYNLPSKLVYEVYNKVISNDSICYYKDMETNKYELGCLYTIYKSQSDMVEYDPYYDNELIYFKWNSGICK